MAAEPVSPEVATTTLSSCPRLPRMYSKRLPRNWSATSLNARVGPWKSSIRWMGPTGRTGTGSGPVQAWSGAAGTGRKVA